MRVYPGEILEREAVPSWPGASMAPDSRWGEPNLPSEIIVAVIDERISVALAHGRVPRYRHGRFCSEAVVYGA